MMRRWAAIVIFLVGLFICVYPLITKVYYNYEMSNQSEKINMQFQVESKEQKIKYSQFEEYNQQMLSYQAIEPPKVKVQKDDIENKGMYSDSIIATVKIPKLKLHYPVYDQATPENLNRGVSRVVGTSFPVGGTSTNSVLAAHSYSPYHEWFTHIDRLKNGDQIIINNFKETLYYKVYDRTIVTPDKIGAMAIRKGKDIITLLTCTPSGEERILIYAERASEEGKVIKPEHTISSIKEKSLADKMKVLSDSWFVILIVALLTFIFIWQLKNNR